MDKPAPVSVDLSAMLESLERLYMTQRARGFARPKPKLLEPDNPNAADIPAAFLEWWKGHRNCDVSPKVAWQCQYYRQEFYSENNKQWEERT